MERPLAVRDVAKTNRSEGVRGRTAFGPDFKCEEMLAVLARTMSRKVRSWTGENRHILSRCLPSPRHPYHEVKAELSSNESRSVGHAAWRCC